MHREFNLDGWIFTSTGRMSAGCCQHLVIIIIILAIGINPSLFEDSFKTSGESVSKTCAWHPLKNYCITFGLRHNYSTRTLIFNISPNLQLLSQIKARCSLSRDSIKSLSLIKRSRFVTNNSLWYFVCGYWWRQALIIRLKLWSIHTL